MDGWFAAARVAQVAAMKVGKCIFGEVVVVVVVGGGGGRGSFL